MLITLNELSLILTTHHSVKPKIYWLGSKAVIDGWVTERQNSTWFKAKGITSVLKATIYLGYSKTYVLF